MKERPFLISYASMEYTSSWKNHYPLHTQNFPLLPTKSNSTKEPTHALHGWERPFENETWYATNVIL